MIIKTQIDPVTLVIIAIIIRMVTRIVTGVVIATYFKKGGFSAFVDITCNITNFLGYVFAIIFFFIGVFQMPRWSMELVFSLMLVISFLAAWIKAYFVNRPGTEEDCFYAERFDLYCSCGTIEPIFVLLLFLSSGHQSASVVLVGIAVLAMILDFSLFSTYISSRFAKAGINITGESSEDTSGND